jgi:hypothetical protein
MKHYARWRRNGDPNTVLVQRAMKPAADVQCSVEGCDRIAKSRGWCNKHYLRWRKSGDPLVVKHEVSRAGPLATFWAYVDKRGPGECWPWRRPPGKNGYGQLQWTDGKVWNAHRIAYVVAHGSIPVSDDPGDPIEIDHMCHTTACTVKPCPHRLCCNPAHLEAKPRSANTGRTTFWTPCPPGCACGRHMGRGRRASRAVKCAPGCKCGRHNGGGNALPCPPGCTCGKHTRSGRRRQLPAMHK